MCCICFRLWVGHINGWIFARIHRADKCAYPGFADPREVNALFPCPLSPWHSQRLAPTTPHVPSTPFTTTPPLPLPSLWITCLPLPLAAPRPQYLVLSLVPPFASSLLPSRPPSPTLFLPLFSLCPSPLLSLSLPFPPSLSSRPFHPPLPYFFFVSAVQHRLLTPGV